MDTHRITSGPYEIIWLLAFCSCSLLENYGNDFLEIQTREKSQLPDKDLHHGSEFVESSQWVPRRLMEPRSFGSGGLALVLQCVYCPYQCINTAYIRRHMGKGKERLTGRERERARKVTTTEHEAHKFSCASAGTAVPLWTSSVLQ